ncbi:MAG: dihydropyrimidinase [Bacillota bacterium]
MFDLIVQNGIVVTPLRTFKADIGICNGKISTIGDKIAGDAKETYDASGKYVLPGVIDVHTHIDHLGGGAKTNDDFYTGSISAAYGGVTTFLDFAMQKKGEDAREAIKRRRAAADGQVVIDYGLHSNLTDLNEESFSALESIVEDGYSSFKLFMTYRKAGFIVEDGVLFALMEEMSNKGALVGIHAENDGICEYLTEKLVKQGKLSPESHAVSRPVLAEAECVSRAIMFAEATNTPLYVFHLSSKKGLDIICQAKNKGIPVYTETCPHYLTLTAERYKEAEGQNYIMTPPLREQEDIDALWQGISQGYIQIVSSDHCAFNSEQKAVGKSCFRDVAPGIPGTETLLPLLYSEGVCKGRITLNQLVEILAYNPAKIFGLAPEKGLICNGSDADLAIIDPNREIVLSKNTIHMATDYTPYEGMRVKGYPDATIVRGRFVIKDGIFEGSRGFGSFIKRKKFAIY